MPTLAEQVDPRRAALLLIDLQAHVEHQKNYVLDIPRMIARTKRLVEHAKAAGVTCIYTRGVEREETNTPVWISRHVTKPHRLGTRARSPGPSSIKTSQQDRQPIHPSRTLFHRSPLERSSERHIDSPVPALPQCVRFM